MIDKSHIQKFNDLKKYTPSKKEIKQLREDIYDFIPVISSIAKHYKINDAEKLPEGIFAFTHSLFETYSKSKYIDSLLYEHQAIESLIKDPAFIVKEYNNVKDIPNTHTVYTADLTRAKKLAIVNALDEINTIKEFAKNNNITKTTNLKDIIFYDKENEEKLKSLIKLTLKILNEDKIENQILLMLKKQLPENEAYTKEQLISGITSLYDFFSTFRFDDLYMKSYEFNSEKFGLEELKYEKSTGLFSKDTLGFKELFSEEYLQTLDINELAFLNAFWNNRFSKECARFSRASSAIFSLDLYQDILDKKTNFNISDKELCATIQKSSYISYLLRDSFFKLQTNIVAKEIKEGINFNDSFSKDITPYYQQLHNFIGEDYSNFFSQYLNGDNSFIDDVIFASPLVNLEMFSYNRKNTTVEPIIKYLLDNPYALKNWGLIREELADGTYFDSIDSKRPRVLIGFDIEGFNSPFRLHINTDSLMELAKLSNGNYLIPEYQGADDFVVNINGKDELIPSNIIMPIPKRHKKIIMDSAKDVSKNTNLWEHMYFLMNGKFPKHLTQTIAKSKKQVSTSRIPICYTDLKTGKRYQKINNIIQEVNGNDGR